MYRVNKSNFELYLTGVTISTLKRRLSLTRVVGFQSQTCSVDD